MTKPDTTPPAASGAAPAEDAGYELLSELAGIDTYDVDLRDHPKAWEALGRYGEALAPARACEVLPDNLRKSIEWCATALQAIASSEGILECTTFRRGDTGDSKSLEDILDEADAALASREAAQPASPAPLTGTPAAEWRLKGEPDPHAGRYDCERAELMLGELTDDELANGAFMNYDVRLSFDELVNPKPGQYPPIAWMTAVKDRIRWLSRALEAALASPQVAPALTDMMKVWGMSAADLEAGPDKTSMDHYNKGVAAGIRQCIADCTRLAAPMQPGAAADDDYRPRGFMCSVDFDHEVGFAPGGQRVFADLDELKQRKKCWTSCGVVEVELRVVAQVEPQDFGEDKLIPAAKPAEEQGS